MKELALMTQVRSICENIYGNQLREPEPKSAQV
jgi:hypothetical protein